MSLLRPGVIKQHKPNQSEFLALTRLTAYPGSFVGVGEWLSLSVLFYQYCSEMKCILTLATIFYIVHDVLVNFAGTFLCNNEMERKRLGLTKKTVSLW